MKTTEPFCMPDPPCGSLPITLIPFERGINMRTRDLESFPNSPRLSEELESSQARWAVTTSQGSWSP